eukprot:TRINITY_DN501_c2_g1_i1.p1 TRINITY_DN501_c2_g1~~TRINITY_DN501_c2_g1_i1.p1  ORF type:complete len:469 (-),score=114.50 TRINITY_DN501_c2_g1_i1:106-1455(-)
MVLYRLFVGGLPATVSGAELAKRFESFGVVSTVDVIREEPESVACKGFAFLTLDVPNISECIHVMNGARWLGSPLRVEIATPDYKARLQAEKDEVAGKEAEQRAHLESVANKPPTTDPVNTFLVRMKGRNKGHVNPSKIKHEVKTEFETGPPLEKLPPKPREPAPAAGGRGHRSGAQGPRRPAIPMVARKAAARFRQQGFPAATSAAPKTSTFMPTPKPASAPKAEPKPAPKAAVSNPVPNKVAFTAENRGYTSGARREVGAAKSLRDSSKPKATFTVRDTAVAAPARKRPMQDSGVTGRATKKAKQQPSSLLPPPPQQQPRAVKWSNALVLPKASDNTATFRFSFQGSSDTQTPAPAPKQGLRRQPPVISAAGAAMTAATAMAAATSAEAATRQQQQREKRNSKPSGSSRLFGWGDEPLRKPNFKNLKACSADIKRVAKTAKWRAKEK